MMIRFVLKRYSYNTPNTLNCIGSTVVDAPFPDDVNKALGEGYLLDDVCIVNEVSNAPHMYSNAIQ